jgi:ATP-dependent Clp protease ATP-binding subunit ClpA
MKVPDAPFLCGLGVVQVLSRHTKNNPVLIGEPGVGKTTIVEGSGATHHRR